MTHPSQIDLTAAPADADSPQGPSTPTLSVEQLHFGYRPGRPVIEGIDAALRPGRLTALIGPNATGKTTLLRLMLGQLVPLAGRAAIDGRDAHRMEPRTRARRVAYVAQRGSVAFGFTVRQVVAMGDHAGDTRSPDRSAIGLALRDCDLEAVADRPVNELSGGQQHRVAIARALVQVRWGERGGGRALLLDEPVAGADPLHAHQALSLLRTAAREDRAVLVVLHDLNLAARFADDVWVMDGGRIVAAGSWDRVMDAELLSRVYGLNLTPLRLPGDDRPIYHAALPTGPHKR